MKAVVAAFNQEKALVGAFSVIMKLRMELFEALVHSVTAVRWHMLGRGNERCDELQPGYLHHNAALAPGYGGWIAL